MGWATFVFAVSSDNTEVAAKAFIVHNNAGGRVSCGLLSSDAAANTTVVTVNTTVNTIARLSGSATNVVSFAALLVLAGASM
jgi:hypothetical protein